MKKTGTILCLLLFVAAGMAASGPQVLQPLSRTMVNARYVYVTSYDGDQFDSRILPEDRDAIVAVQNAIQDWGRFALVYRPEQADIVLMVQSRPSEDVLAVYDAHGWPSYSYVWRATGRNGLQENETPLVTDFRQAIEKNAK